MPLLPPPKLIGSSLRTTRMRRISSIGDRKNRTSLLISHQITSPNPFLQRILIHLHTLCPPPHLHAPSSGSQGTSITLTMTQQTLLPNNLWSSLKSLTPPSLLPTTLQLILVHSSPPHGTTPGTRDLSPNFVQLKQRNQLHGPLQTLNLAMKK